MTNFADIVPTDSALIERCKAATKKSMSREERFQQKVSFVMGMLSHKSKTKREEVIKFVKEIEGIEDDPS